MTSICISSICIAKGNAVGGGAGIQCMIASGLTMRNMSFGDNYIGHNSIEIAFPNYRDSFRN